ncbi:hypothetical protein O9929_05005 [Vibrio lentus]|nr:hypothetical protein [Vibrio lentus]
MLVGTLLPLVHKQLVWARFQSAHHSLICCSSG